MDKKPTGGVVRHTPDPTAYHPNISGYGVTIPAASIGGGSQGFDPADPVKVIVDPDISDGNKIIDFRLFRQNVEDFNKAVNESGASEKGAFHAYVSAAEKISEKKEKEMAKNQEIERLKDQDRQLQDRERELVDQSAVYYDGGDYSPPKPARPVPIHSPPPQRVPQDAAPSDSYMLQQLMSGMAQQRETINRLIALQTTPDPEPDSPPSEVQFAEEPAGPTTTQIEEKQAKVKATERLIAGFETLEMPFITGPLAMKPKKEVYFEMPNAGTMAARYHDIRDGGSCLALIYDTRYEDGIQFMPPTLGDTKIRITLPRENKVYVASSLGIHFSCGVLDIVVMFKHDEENSEEGDLL